MWPYHLLRPLYLRTERTPSPAMLTEVTLTTASDGDWEMMTEDRLQQLPLHHLTGIMGRSWCVKLLMIIQEQRK